MEPCDQQQRTRLVRHVETRATYKFADDIVFSRGEHTNAEFVDSFHATLRAVGIRTLSQKIVRGPGRAVFLGVPIYEASENWSTVVHGESELHYW